MSAATASRTTSRADGLLAALRATALLSVLAVAWQFVTAGQLIASDAGEELHGGGAIALHVLSGLAAVAAVLHCRRSGVPWWPAVLAVVVFAVTFVQAYTGSHGPLAVHVPGSLVVSAGSVWLLAWSLTRGARPALL